MDAKEQFPLLINHRLTQFLKSIKDNPNILEKIARDIAQHGKEMEEDYPSDTQSIHEIAIEVVDIMAKGAASIDLFLTCVKNEDYSLLAPGAFLERADSFPEIDPVKSVDVINLVVNALTGVKEAHPKTSAGELFFENYFGEYVANIFNISFIESLGDKKDLLKEAKVLLDSGDEEFFYNLFTEANEKLKHKLTKVNYHYQDILPTLP